MISFIVPVKNQLYYTKAILEEIQTKCPYKFEIIFINDNSTDDTEAFLSLIENEDIKVITNKENVGVNNSRNKGVELARYDLCMIINNDIVFTKNTVKELVELADRENYNIICPVSTRGPNKRQMPVFYKDNNICGWCYLIRKQDNLFPIPSQVILRYGDDYLFTIGKVKHLTTAIVHHRESKTINSPEIKERVQKTVANDKIEWDKIKGSLKKIK